MTPVPWKLWEGQVVDQSYPLRRYLGGGDRSAVYLTQFGEPPQNAAIKLYLAEALETDPTAQWERAAQLSHPNLLRLLQIGRCQVNQLALRYIVMEYADENLAEVLAERPLTPAEVREMLKPLLGGLAYLHHEGLVHGHIKPANVLAVGDELKLPVDGVTLVGEPTGTLAPAGPYDPPELLERGDSPVGDVWSFGVTLVEALTQKLPTLAGPKEEPLLPPALPAEFLPMARACLQPDPRRRASLDRVLEMFARPQTGGVEVVKMPVAVAGPPEGRWLRPAAAGVAVLALAGILFGPRLLRHPVADAPSTPVEASPPPSSVAVPEAAPKGVKPTPFARPQAELPRPAARPEAAPKVERTVPAVAERTVPAVAERSVETVPGQVVHQVLPEIPDYARRSIRGTVKIIVRAKVDAAGHVTGAAVESQNSKYFAKLSLAAARQWEFAPAAGDWLLRFEFTKTDTQVRPARVAR